MMKGMRGVRVETLRVGGNYQHKVTEYGVETDRNGGVSEEVVELQKRANERLWDEMLEGDGPVVGIVKYRVSGKGGR